MIAALQRSKELMLSGSVFFLLVCQTREYKLLLEFCDTLLF